MFLLSLAATEAVAPEGGSFVVYSNPIKLRYGEVHNKYQQPLPLPHDVVKRYADGAADGWMAITGYTLDIVHQRVDGSEVSVPLYDAYLHHYILQMGEMGSLAEVYDAAQHDPNSFSLRGMRPAGALQALQARGKGKYASFGGASGAEYRHNPHNFSSPFAVVAHKPTSWYLLLTTDY